MNRRRRNLIPGLVSAFVLWGAALAAGADYVRVAPGSGSFFNTARWSPAGVPGAADRAIFDLSGIYAVSFGASPGPTVANQRLRISDDDVTFDLDGRLYALTSTSSTSLSIGGGSRGLGGVDDGELRIIDGTLRAESAIVGDGSSTFLKFGSGLLEISTGATFIVPGSLLIGENTQGTFRIDSGGDADTFFATIGYDALGTATVTGAGSTWTSDSLDIDNGTLNIQSAGLVETTAFVNGPSIGITPGATGVVNISGFGSNGVGSKWDNAAGFIIGNGGNGSLHISDKAIVETHFENIIANSSGSTGQVTVDGIDSRWTANSNLVVGNMGSGSLAVTNGGAILSASETSIGAHPIGTGIVSVSGGGLLETLNGLFVGGGEFADGGTATLDITTGGRTFVSYSGATKLWGPGTINLNGGRLETGRLELLGGTFNWTAGTLALTGSDLLIEPTGLFGAALALGSDRHLEANRLLVGQNGNGMLSAEPNDMVSTNGLVIGGNAEGDARFNGSVVTTKYEMIIGDELNSEGTMTLENLTLWNHSTQDPNSPFVVGDKGVGTLNILSDSDVLLGEQTLPIVGNEPTGRGTINLDGEGSELVLGIQGLSLGFEGEGLLNITDGGVLTGGGVVVAYGTSGLGAIHITGADSALRASAVVIGFNGVGTLEVAGATLEIADAGYLETSFETVLALNMGSTATATVDGAGSRLSAIEDATLIVGGGGSAALTISGGANADAHEVIIGDGFAAVGNVLVTGPGSRLDAREELLIGYNGEATLTLTDGGVASAPLVEINALSSLRGNGTFEGDLTSFGLVSPGMSPGALSIDGNYTQAANGELLIELASASSFDQLLVTGAATLSGTLNVGLIDGYVPSPGESFTFLTADDIDGTFTTEVLPSVPGLIFDLVYNPQSVVLTVSPAFTADFDEDGDVDGDDLGVWQAAYGVNALADADGDGDSDGRDFLTWQRQFGSGVLPPLAASTAVPEPVCLAPLFSLVLLLNRSRSPAV